jgi:hypothetical protein
MFTKRHYILVAAQIKRIRSRAERGDVCAGFASTFSEDNPLFSPVKFYKASNVRLES